MLSFNLGEEIVGLFVNVIVDIVFLGVIGKNIIMVGFEIEVIWFNDNIEVVLVLDNIGFMCGFKIVFLCMVVNVLVDIMFGD